MGFIPSIKLSNNLEKAGVGVWVEQLGDGRIALVCKVPETAIKTLYRGAACTFLLSTIQAESLTFLCLGFWIADERESPFKASMVNSFPEDTALLAQILASGTTTLHCMNELNHPVLSAWCALESGTAAAAAESLRSSNHWLCTPASAKLVKMDGLLRMLELALDRFQHHMHRAPDDPIAEYVTMTATIPMKLEIWKPRAIFEVTPTASGGPFLISDEDEGPKLERLIQVLVDSIYPGNTYTSPDVQDGKVLREVTDVLGFNPDSICVVQAKAMAVFSAAADQSSSRRAANVEKDIKKGLKQVAGALTNIRNGSAIFPKGEQKPVDIPNRTTSSAHALVILSEMYAFVDWKAVAATVAKASDSEAHGAFFHVLDIQELANVAANCTDASTFINRLIERWFLIQDRGTAYLRTKFRKALDSQEE
jgi:hypothetical protein